MTTVRLYVDVPDVPAGALVPVELLDLETRQRVDALATTGAAVEVDVGDATGPLNIQAILASGQVLTTHADADAAEPIVLTETGSTGGPSAALAATAPPWKTYSGAWARLWSPWKAMPQPKIDVRADGSGLQWPMHIDVKDRPILQVGGDDIPQRCVVLPPADRLTATLKRTHRADTDSFGHGYTVTIRTDDARAEALIAYTAAGQLAAARTIAADYEPFALKGLYGPSHDHPIGLIVLGYYQLRTREIKQLGRWLRGFESLADHYADIAVLLIGQLLLSPKPDAEELGRLVTRAAQAGMPAYTEGLRWLYRAIELLMTTGADDDQLRWMHTAVRRYADAADWDAVLTSFRGDPADPTVEPRTGPPGSDGGAAISLHH